MTFPGYFRRNGKLPPSFPIVKGTNSNVINSTGTSVTRTVNLPSGIVAGELLVIVNCTKNVSGSISPPAGWTSVFDATSSAGGNTLTMSVLYKIADGSEGASVSYQRSGDKSAHFSFRLANATGVPAVAGPSTGTSAAPNSPSLSPSWGLAKTLWLTAFNLNTVGGNGNAPSGYGGTLTQSTSSGSGVSAGVSYRALETATEDPASWSTSVSSEWQGITIGIKGTT